MRASGSTLNLAKVLVVTSLPALLLNPFAGVYVDRWDRKRTMITCDLIRAVVILSFPWLALAQSQVPLYIGVFILFAVAAFFVPARLAVIPDLVPADRLAEANALFTTSGMIGSTLTFLLGALLIEWIGATRSSWVNAAGYLGSAIFIAPIVRTRRERSSPSASFTLILREVAEGIKELWRHQETRRVAGLLAILMGGSGATVVLGTVLVQQALRTVTKDLGFLSLWLGIGMLLGTIAYGRWGTKRSRRLILGLAFLGCGSAIGFFIGAVLGIKTTASIVFSAGLLGFWVAPVGIITNTMVHEAHPERLHGRIFSSLGVVLNLALIFSMLTAGWLGERMGRGALLGVIGAGYAFSGILLLCYTKLRRKENFNE